MRGETLLSIMVASVLYLKKATFYSGEQELLCFPPTFSFPLWSTYSSSVPQPPQPQHHQFYQQKPDSFSPKALLSLCICSNLVLEKLLYL